MLSGHHILQPIEYKFIINTYTEIEGCQFSVILTVILDFTSSFTHFNLFDVNFLHCSHLNSFCQAVTATAIRWLETTCGMKPRTQSFWLGRIRTADYLYGGMDRNQYGWLCRSWERRCICTSGLVSRILYTDGISFFLNTKLSFL